MVEQDPNNFRLVTSLPLVNFITTSPRTGGETQEQIFISTLITPDIKPIWYNVRKCESDR